MGVCEDKFLCVSVGVCVCLSINLCVLVFEQKFVCVRVSLCVLVFVGENKFV